VDETRRLREITLLFFREGMASLAVMQEDMEAFPDSEEARRRWIEEVRQFAARAEGLHHRWTSVYMNIGKPKPDPVEARTVNYQDTPTPSP
jgi:hypothetical protein